MKEERPKRRPPQRIEGTRNKTGRKRRIYEVLPELRERIKPLFDRGMTVERIAEELNIDGPPWMVLEHVVRENTGAKHPGPYLTRRPAQVAQSSTDSAPTVRQFKVMRQIA
jgi:hypothetical protein